MAGNFLFAWNNKPENGMPFKSMASSTETEIKNKFTSTTSAGWIREFTLEFTGRKADLGLGSGKSKL
jgi:hypothetical protein